MLSERPHQPYSLSKFLRQSLIFIIKGFRTIVFIFIVISTTFRPICHPAFFRCLLSKFLRRSLIFIIKGFRTIVFIFIVISTTFRPICHPAFFRCLLSKFLRRSLIFIIKGFRTIVFIFIVISTTFRPTSSGVYRTREPTQNFELRSLLNPWGSPVLIPLAITGYKY